jgi:predicted amidohydrolase YtcJ
MTTLSRRLLLSALGATGLGASLRSEPDLVLHHGRIWTVSERLPEAQAIAMLGERIVAVGSDEDILALAGPSTRKLDLGGKRVTPGFNDAHAHPAEGGVDHLRLVACDRDSLAEIQAALRARAARTPAGQWVQGFLYDDGKTPRPLTRADLDAAVPAHPVLVTHRGGHTIFVNSLALKLAGIAETTPDPPGGRYFRDGNGRLNGRIGDKATAPFERFSNYPRTREDYRQGASLISKMFSAKGVTSACDAGGSPETLQGYQDARDAGDLRMRVYCHILAERIDQMMAAGVHTGLGGDWVKLGAQKLFADGSISERTAWLSQPYLGMAERFTGLATLSRDELYAKAKRAHLAGWQLGIHANGDNAIAEVLGVYEQLQRETPKRDPRFRIEHCTLVNPELVGRMRAVGAVPVPFAGYVYFHGDVMHFYGKSRLEHMFAMRSFLDAGLRPPSSSDYTASPSQVTRTDFHHQVWGPSQRITLPEAIRCGTLNGAYAAFEDREKGTLEPGKLGDLVVWTEDPLSVDPGALIHIRAERTMVGGRWVYES